MNLEDNAFVAYRDELIESILRLTQLSGASAFEQRRQLQIAIANYTVGIVGLGRSPEFYDSYIRHVFVEVAQGRGKHGDFLRTFAEALMRADAENFSLLRATALDMIEKYDLMKYLDSFPSSPAANNSSDGGTAA